ncbi:ABC transporter permease [Vibrio sp. 10N.286.49.B3]|uniref:TolC family protein n=1 Tax=Vibrio sp. 10N.286.49.B3 TaxID=1880855 RepID=UPI000C865B45|nr:TolC family protein [Vibrio sp. 10N.286.49.B3]PMH42204.1 ABC transporter permease [Vibrio sp. 10N.286.49.B3]
MWQFKSLIRTSFYTLCTLTSSHLAATSLLEAVNLSLENNLSLQASQLGIEQSEYNIGVSRSKFLPSLSASASTTYNKNETILNQTPNTKSNYNSNDYSISLSQSIFNMKDIYQYGTAKLDFSIEQLSHDNKIQTTISDVASKYFEYLKSSAQIRATEAELKSSFSREAQMKRNIQLGNTAASEIYEVIAQKEGINNRLRTLHKDQTVTLNDLAALVQYPITPSQDIFDSVPLEPISDNDKNNIISEAIKLNNDIMVANKNLEKSRRELKESSANFLPSVSMSASYRFDDANNFDRTDPTATGDSNSTSVGLTLSVPIYSGGSNYYDYQKSALGIERNEILLKDTLATTKSTINTSILNINDYSSSILIYENIIRANYSSYRGIQRAYQLGTRTITDLLAAESKLFSALRDYESARYDYIIEIINLEQIKGLLTIQSIESTMSLMGDISNQTDDELVPKHLLSPPTS